jgi:hypothetical protein
MLRAVQPSAGRAEPQGKHQKLGIAAAQQRSARPTRDFQQLMYEICGHCSTGCEDNLHLFPGLLWADCQVKCSLPRPLFQPTSIPTANLYLIGHQLCIVAILTIVQGHLWTICYRNVVIQTKPLTPPLQERHDGTTWGLRLVLLYCLDISPQIQRFSKRNRPEPSLADNQPKHHYGSI